MDPTYNTFFKCGPYQNNSQFSLSLSLYLFIILKPFSKPKTLKHFSKLYPKPTLNFLCNTS